MVATSLSRDAGTLTLCGTRLRAVDAPYGFSHDLDRSLFTLDRIDELFRRAPAGKAGVQVADPDRERAPGAGPVLTTLEGSIEEDIARRPLHVHLHDITEWAPEYLESRRQVLEHAGIDANEPRYAESTVIRVFSPETQVSLHGDGETQINCGLNGRNVWHVYTPSALSQQENEGLLRGGQFVPWREMSLFATYDLSPGDAFAAPPRWPHWIEHPGPDPAVSFEVGYYTVEDLRMRKVWDVNWLIRKAHLQPLPPSKSESRDRMKRRVFDAISLVTRKGGELRGV
jgi:hypothetical protein